MYLVPPRRRAGRRASRSTTDKARTAAIYRRPSKDFEDQASGGRAVGAAPRPGGAAPGRHADRVTTAWSIGAIGVSGASVGPRGPRACGTGRPVDSGCDRGPRERRQHGRRGALPVCRVGREVPCRRSAARHPDLQGRRGAPRGPGRGRVPRTRRGRHARGERPRDGGDRGLDGRFARGGTRRASRRRIEGGRRPGASEGDVLAIPNGVPHQFTDVSDPFLYFEVKVAA